MAEIKNEKTEENEILNREETLQEDGAASETAGENSPSAEKSGSEEAPEENTSGPEENSTSEEASEEAASGDEAPGEAEASGKKEPAAEEGRDQSGKEEPEGSRKGKKKGFFKKEKKDKKDEKIEELTDRLQRQMAEFDNFRKRTEKEKASMYQIGAKDVIEKILPVIDNFERGLQTGDASDPFVDGMNKIYKQMVTMLTELGVTPIEAVGKPFDPNLHNAVMHIDDESAGENEVVEEFQKGYLYKDAVVRYSMVKVAN